MTHAKLREAAEAATPGPWSLDNHQCLCAPDGAIVVDYSCVPRGQWEADAAYLLAVQPRAVLALLDEIAELRAGAENSEWHWKTWAGAKVQEAALAERFQLDRATRLEAELSAARAGLPDLSSVISWLINGCDIKHAIVELQIYHARIEAARQAAITGGE